MDNEVGLYLLNKHMHTQSSAWNAIYLRKNVNKYVYFMRLSVKLIIHVQVFILNFLHHMKYGFHATFNKTVIAVGVST